MKQRARITAILVVTICDSSFAIYMERGERDV